MKILVFSNNLELIKKDELIDESKYLFFAKK